MQALAGAVRCCSWVAVGSDGVAGVAGWQRAGLSLLPSLYLVCQRALKGCSWVCYLPVNVPVTCSQNLAAHQTRARLAHCPAQAAPFCQSLSAAALQWITHDKHSKARTERSVCARLRWVPTRLGNIANAAAATAAAAASGAAQLDHATHQCSLAYGSVSSPM